MSAPPDGHRCAYEHREGKGPRGGRRTWTTARCVDCGATAEVQDARPGAGDGQRRARADLVAAAPRCPRPRVLSAAGRALVDLAAALARHERVVPPLPWCVEHVPDGDVAAAAQRAWDACDEPDALCALVAACLPSDPRYPSCAPFTAARCHAEESGARWFVDLYVDELDVELRGPAARTAAGIRAHLPRVPWGPTP